MIVKQGEVAVFSSKKGLKIVKFGLCAIAVFTSAMVFAAVKDEVSARLSPVGDLCMAGDSCAAAPVVVASGPRSGEDIYGKSCIACHSSGAAGAPKLGDVAGWAPRIGQGIDTLYTHAISGFNGMPAKGLCMDCSEDEIKVTVDYMVSKSQ
ncbi:MAG: cytochrome c5 [Candidatus Endobugula sp.]